jgi:hypothetical protein
LKQKRIGLDGEDSLNYIHVFVNPKKEKFTERYTKEEQKKILNDLIFAVLFFSNIVTASSPVLKLSQYIANFCGSTTIPFLQFILPGALFYHFIRKCGDLS